MATTAATFSRDDWPPGRVLVVSATYNERDNIVALIDRVLAVSPELQLLIVDDDSPDGTGRVALERAEAEPRLHVLVRHGRRGLGSAIVEGFRLGRQHGFDVAVNAKAIRGPPALRRHLGPGTMPKPTECLFEFHTFKACGEQWVGAQRASAAVRRDARALAVQRWPSELALPTALPQASVSSRRPARDAST